MPTPLLTIAIPTFNRSRFLALSLARLESELARVPRGVVELIVSDNASTDDTLSVLDAARARGLPVHVHYNDRNRGADINTAQCFALATGRFVLILGDDDLLVAGALPRLLALLTQDNYGVLCLRPYGYDRNDAQERPVTPPCQEVFDDAGRFLIRCGPLVTFISACVINKSWILDINPFALCGGQLVQMHLVLAAGLRADRNLFVFDYLIACKRNNSGGYDFASVFVTEFGRILDLYAQRGLTQSTCTAIEQRMILTFHPAALLRERQKNVANLTVTRARFSARLAYNPLYRIVLEPIMAWPQPLAFLWGTAAMALGRLSNGDWPRGLAFVRTQLRQMFSGR